MSISAKVKINGQTFKKGLRLSGLSIVEQVLTGQLTSEDLKRPTTYEQGSSFGNDIVIRLAGFNLAKNVKKARIQEELAVAKYFQILVSNTPIDEEYVYNAVEYTDRISSASRARWKELSKEKQKLFNKIYYLDNYTSTVKKRKNYHEQVTSELDEAFAKSDVAIEYENRIEDINLEIKELKKSKEEDFIPRTHKPDNDYIRGDWVLVYRGVRYQAFKTDRDNGADVYFSEDLFEKIDDFKSVTKIAEILHNNVGNGIIGGGLRTINDNPKYKVLEYGGYITESEAKEGTRYHKPHGVTNKHSYQAPKGYHRLVAAMWNDIAKDAKTGRYQKYITEWTKKDMGSFDVSNVDTKVMKKLLKKRTVSANEVNLKQLTKGAVK